jgi:hypothetical protein
MNTEDFTTPSLDNEKQPSFTPSCKIATIRAFNKMKTILFKPFSFEKWLVLAFCVWLVNMFEDYGQGLGFFGNLDPDHISYLKKINLTAEASSFVNKAKGVTQTEIGMSLIITVIIIFIFIIIAAVIIFILMWVKSRFSFIFLDNLKKNAENISEPWKYYRRIGNSCFLWSICFQAISFLITAVIFTVFFVILFNILNRGQESTYALTVLTFSTALFFLLFSLIYIIIFILFKHFVIPVMYKMEINSIPAWGKIIALIRQNPGSFIKYFFILWFYSIISVIIVFLLIICTCCLLGCLFSIPLAGGYISSLVLLPIFIFFRLFGVEYLAQFGEVYDLKILNLTC